MEELFNNENRKEEQAPAEEPKTEAKPKVPMTPAEKIKNLSALAILLGGLFLGSLVVDLVQLATGSGFSGHVAKSHDVLESQGKTWVSYAEPKVGVTVVTEEACANCDPSEPLVWLRRVVPTLEANRVESASEVGQALIERFQITSLPAFVFSDDVIGTDFYAQAESLFLSDGNFHYFDMTKIGLPAGKYLKHPEMKEGDNIVGSKDAPVKLFVFSDFQCPFCKNFHADIQSVIKEYGGQVAMVYRHLPLSIHQQSGNAALAAECANEQGKFAEYADMLFSKQDEWGNTTNVQKFKDYAYQLRLDGRQFAACIDTQKYKDKVIADISEADGYAISGTPGTFIQDEFYDGALSVEELKASIDKALGK